MKSVYAKDGITLYRGEALATLQELDGDSVDVLCTDPPYASISTEKPSAKYIKSGVYPDFVGDSRSESGWRYWCALWLSQGVRIVRPSGYALVFTDWRRIAGTIANLEAGGFVYRGIVAWNKGEAARGAHTGMFRGQCEYIVWGTKGVSRPAAHGGPFPGCYWCPVLQRNKHHMTGKPTALMRKLLAICPPGGRVLDPFAGSGTTLVAARELGLEAIGMEVDATYCAVATKRLTATE